eukprot:CAMPEP_0184859756 /NCGR_PEP_ID=MMETSP0580-20130426/4750_1 /TAXON_ID=1118495 /ORGANISM="Dactyliosolen fragilissimus" /LENGTH=269 /DNA_ID=CAMNT_0027356575 /DNA_START=334 /DNA_END=1140 /DNA_ORIENTATION=+
MNPIRVSYIVDRILHQQHSIHGNAHAHAHAHVLPLHGLKALDVGCGGGLLSTSLARLGANVTAIDPSMEVAMAARERSKLDRDEKVRNHILYKGGIGVEDLAAKTKTTETATATATTTETTNKEQDFDLICILEVIEHAQDPMELLRSASSLLKPPSTPGKNDGGLLFLSTINRTFKSYGMAILGGEYIMRKLPIGTHNWNNFLSPSEVQHMMQHISNSNPINPIPNKPHDNDDNTNASTNTNSSTILNLKQIHLQGMILQPPFLDMRW